MRIKDLTSVAGVRDNQLVGYGLVVGLDGTGDKTTQAPFTQQTFRNMLTQFGIKLPNGINFELKNVAAVAISAKLHPFAKPGQTIDVNVSSIGNSTSLRGGELLMTPLRGADNQIYAVAQGSVVVSGFGAQGADGSKVTVNTTSSGRIPNGATIEAAITAPFVKNGIVTFQLNEPDFTTADRIAKVINKKFRRIIAKPSDASSIDVNLQSYIPNSTTVIRDYKDEAMGLAPSHAENLGPYVKYISSIENLTLDPAATRARIIVNSRTGTIVIDQNVMISAVAVAHGNLSVVVSERPFVSQPNALAAGNTVSGTASDINVNQTQNRAFVLKAGTSLKDLVDEINRVGAAPGDIIAILEAVKAAGALHADLEVI
jgi:flagellar P-ring protein precursor FlgI